MPTRKILANSRKTVKWVSGMTRDYRLIGAFKADKGDEHQIGDLAIVGHFPAIRASVYGSRVGTLSRDKLARCVFTIGGVSRLSSGARGIQQVRIQRATLTGTAEWRRLLKHIKAANGIDNPDDRGNDAGDDPDEDEAPDYKKREEQGTEEDRDEGDQQDGQ